MNKIYIYIGLSGAALLVALLFFIGLNNKKPPGVAWLLEETADLTLSHISFVQTRKGLKDWELTAKEAQFFEKNQAAFLRKIFVAMESDQGLPLTLSGDQGTMDAGGKSFSIQKGEEPVSVRLSNGYTIKTASLTWFSEERVIQTEDPVEISGSGVAVYGTGMRLSLDNSEITFLKDVHAEIY